jgi:hypothetical protein
MERRKTRAVAKANTAFFSGCSLSVLLSFKKEGIRTITKAMNQNKAWLKGITPSAMCIAKAFFGSKNIIKKRS